MEASLYALKLNAGRLKVLDLVYIRTIRSILYSKMVKSISPKTPKLLKFQQIENKLTLIWLIKRPAWACIIWPGFSFHSTPITSPDESDKRVAHFTTATNPAE